jgi:hypothetical protein
MAGVGASDAGVASGVLNTSRQISGAVGLAAVTALAAGATSSYAHGHAVAATSASALTHGFHVAFLVLTGVALAGALIAAVFVEPSPAAAAARIEVDAVALQEAA